MRPRERRETGEQDLFRSRLDQVINMDHALVKLARTIDWGFLEEKFGAVYADGAGQPPLPTRLMAGLAILKHTYNLSDEVVCELWLENLEGSVRSRSREGAASAYNATSLKPD
jgi:transposase, IS5 family